MDIGQILEGALTVVQIFLFIILLRIIYTAVRMALRSWRSFQKLYAIRKEPLRILDEDEPPHQVRAEEFDEKMGLLGYRRVGRLIDAVDPGEPSRCYWNEAGTIYSVAEMGEDFPAAVMFGSRFADESMVITTSPRGGRVSAERCAYAYAVDWQNAAAHQARAVETWRQQHGEPVLGRMIQQIVENDLYWETHYRRICLARFIRLNLLAVISTLLIIAISAGMMIAMLSGLVIGFTIPVIVMIGITLLMVTINRNWVRPADAVDFQK